MTVDTATTWTIAYRKGSANHFRRATDLATSWHEATEIARRIAVAHAELEVWTTPTTAADAAGYSHPEDIGNILTGTGRRVQIRDTGSLAALVA